jgi:hypothetical protein
VSDTSQQSQELSSLLGQLGVNYSNAPTPTPALLAFLKGIGMNLQTAQQLRDRALERIGAATSAARADIERSAGRSKQNVTADLIRRGVLQSGEANTRYARQAEDVAVKQADVTRASTTAAAESEYSLKQSQDQARMQALDRVIATEQDQANAAAVAAANKVNYERSLSLLGEQARLDAEARQQDLDARLAAINQAGQQGVSV